MLPYACILIAFAFYNLLQTQPKKSRIFLGAIVLYGSIQLYFNISFIGKDVDISDRNAEIGQYIPDESRVYATASFFFNEVQNVKLLSTQSYTLEVSRYNNLTLSKKDFFHHVHSLNCEYIVLDLLFQNYTIHDIFSPADLQEGKKYYGYKIIQSQDDYVVMKRL